MISKKPHFLKKLKSSISLFFRTYLLTISGKFDNSSVDTDDPIIVISAFGKDLIILQIDGVAITQSPSHVGSSISILKTNYDVNLF